MKSRNYSESEKFAAVERFLVGGESVATIAADTGISRSTLYAWIKSAQIEPGMLEFTRKNFLMLEAKEGWFFLDEWEQLTAAEKDCAHGMKGTHGYLPGEADYQTFFAMSGCSVRAGARVEKNIALWDEGATLAALLEIDLGKTDGSVIREMLQ